MASRTLANLGLKAFWAYGETAYNDEMDADFLKISHLVQASAISKVSATPGSPAAGDFHIFDETHPTQANDLAIYDDSAWTYVTPQEGWMVYNKADGYIEQFDGAVWAELATGGGGSSGGSGGGGSGRVTARRYLIQDQRASGTNYGTLTGGIWNTRTLQTEVENEIPSASLAANVITLPAGSYRVRGYVVAFRTNGHKARLRNTTDGVTAVVGSAVYGDATDGGVGVSVIQGIFTITGPTNFEIQSYPSSTQASNGGGIAGTTGEVEIYCSIEIETVSEAAPSVVDSTTARTIALADTDTYLRFTNAAAKTCTVDDETTTPIPINSEVNLRNVGAGNLTIVADAGVTINLPAGGTLVLATGMTATLKKVAADQWDLIGQTVPV